MNIPVFLDFSLNKNLKWTCVFYFVTFFAYPCLLLDMHWFWIFAHATNNRFITLTLVAAGYAPLMSIS